MQKTKIEWVRNPDGTQGYCWNVIKGWCPHNCTYCSSHRRYVRFKLDKTIRFVEQELKELNRLKKPSTLFVCDDIDMYHPNIPVEWVEKIINLSAFFPQHTFITLTKFPENLYKFEFPPNWWVGTTIDDKKHGRRGLPLFNHLNIQGKIFVSFEPLLTEMNSIPMLFYDWIIIGGLTPKPVHKTWWIDDIVRRADDLNIPVFIKKNVKYDTIKKELPK